MTTRIEANPNVSIWVLSTISRYSRLAEMTMRWLVKVDLGLKSLAKVKTQQLTPPPAAPEAPEAVPSLAEQAQEVECQ